MIKLVQLLDFDRALEIALDQSGYYSEDRKRAVLLKMREIVQEEIDLRRSGYYAGKADLRQSENQ